MKYIPNKEIKSLPKLGNIPSGSVFCKKDSEQVFYLATDARRGNNYENIYSGTEWKTAKLRVCINLATGTTFSFDINLEVIVVEEA